LIVATAELATRVATKMPEDRSAPVTTYRRTAVAVGVLFIAAIVMLFVGEAIYRSVLDEPGYLDNAHPDRTRVILGLLVEYTGAPMVVAISLLLYPVLRKHSEGLALGYVAFRVMEMGILSVAYVSRLGQVSLSEDFLDDRGADVSTYRAIGDALESMNDWAGTQGLIYLTIFSLGSFVLYPALYRSELVPSSISIGGIVAAMVLLIGSVLASVHAFGDAPGAGVELVVASPIAIVEVTLSIWLIAKGFNQSAVMPGHQPTRAPEITSR